MPKLTRTGYEIGSSEAGAIILHATAFQSREEVLDMHKKALAGVETVDEKVFSKNALRRGTHLEHSVAAWAAEELFAVHGVTAKMWEPTKAYQRKDLRIASSVDRIIELASPLYIPGGDGNDFELSGEGICEIKTDFYHTNKIKPEWAVQVAHQMICTNHKWGLIICMSQKGKLHYYPVKRDEKFDAVLIDAYKEFWSLVDTDSEYPPSATTKNEPEAFELADVAPEQVAGVQEICQDYLQANAESNRWRKVKEEIKDNLIDLLDGMSVEKLRLSGFEITSKSVLKDKKEYVNTGEKYESQSFSIKEVSHE